MDRKLNRSFILTAAALLLVLMIFRVVGTQTAFAANETVMDRTWVRYTDNGDGTCTIDEFLYKADVSPTRIIIPKTLVTEDGDELQIKKIGNNAFAGAGLSVIKFSDDCMVEEIGSAAFKGNAVSSLKLPDGVKQVGREAFSDTDGIERLDLSNCRSLTVIDHRAFYRAGIKELTLPSGLKKIGSVAFAGNILNTTIEIPASVEQIDEGAFNGRHCNIDCSDHAPGSLKYAPWAAGTSPTGYMVIWNDYNQDIDSNIPFLFDKSSGIIYGLKSDIRTTDANYDYFDKSTGTLTIPPWIGSIQVNGFADYGLANCEGTGSMAAVKKVVFDQDCSIDTLPYSVCRGMTNLEEVELSPWIKNIEGYAFFANPKMKNFDFGDVNNIGANVFSSAGIKEISIGSEIESIAAAAFPDQPSLEKIIIKKDKGSIAGAPWGASFATVYWNHGETTEPVPLLTTDDGNWEFDPVNGTLHRYTGECGPSVDLTVPASVVCGGETYTIRTLGFNRYNILNNRREASFRKVIIPDGIEIISNAFHDIKLDEVDLSQNTTLRMITYYAFANCGLHEFSIPPSVTTLNGRGLEGNNFTGRIEISRNVKTISGDVFKDCTGVTAIKVEQYYNNQDDDKYPPASDSVKANKPYGASNAGNAVYFADQAQPVPDHSISVNKQNNTARISYSIRTNTITDIVKEIAAADGMPHVTMTKTPSSDGRENPAEGYMDIHSASSGGVQGGNGTYAVDISFGHQGSEDDRKVMTYPVILSCFHSVTYDANPLGLAIKGKAPSDSGAYVEGFVKKAALPSESNDPISIAGYRFAGWNTEADGGGSSYPAGEDFEMPDHDLKLYAQWEELKVDVTLDGNGGNFRHGAQKTVTGHYTQTLSELPGYEVPERDGYTFLGWSSDKTAAAADTVAVPENPGTLYAVWGRNIVTLTFDANGGRIDGSGASSVSGYPGSVIHMPNAERTGYTFAGWSRDKAGTEHVESDLMPNRNMSYYARWAANDNSVEFVRGNGGRSLTGERIVKSGEAVGVVPEAEADEGFVFTGQWLSSEGGIYASDEIKDYIISGKTSPVTFTPQFVQQGSSLIIYDFSGGVWNGTGASIFTGQSGSDFAGELPEPAKQGYTYEWNRQRPSKFPAEGTVILVRAVWSPAYNHVSFDAGEGGTTSEPTLTVASGSAVGVKPQAEADEGYRFTGLWESSEGGFFSSEQIKDYVVSGANEQITFTAQFERKTKSTIVFDFRGGIADGSGFMSFSGNAGDNFNKGDVPKPVLPGYSFDRWDGEVPGNYPAAGEIIILTAEWTPLENTVSFIVPEGGSLKTEREIIVNSGKSVDVSPEIELSDGYKFDGYWECSEGGRFTAEQIKTYVISGRHNKVVFTAMIDKIPVYKVVFSAGDYGSAEPASAEVIQGRQIGITPEVTAKDGYVFSGSWKCSEGGTYTSEEIASYKAHGDEETITFTAQFTKKETPSDSGGDTKPQPEQGSDEKPQPEQRSDEKLQPDSADLPSHDPDDDTSSIWRGKTEAELDQLISGSRTEEPAGATFGLLKLKGVSNSKGKVTLKWSKVPGAVKYVVYGNKCGTNNRYKKLTALAGSKAKYTAKKILGKKVGKGKYYKFTVAALDADGRVLGVSKTVHVASAGGKKGNDKSVKLIKPTRKKLSLKAGKSHKIKAKEVKGRLKVSRHRKLAYESTDRKVAVVSKKGKISAKGKGSCTVYVYAQNGVYKTIKINVK